SAAGGLQIESIDTTALARGFHLTLDSTTHSLLLSIDDNVVHGGNFAPDTSFSYTATDASGNTSAATVTISAVNVTSGSNAVNLSAQTYDFSYINALAGNDTVTGGTGANTFIGGPG